MLIHEMVVNQAVGSAKDCATSNDAEGLMQILTNAKQLLQLPQLNPNGGARYLAKIKQALADGKVRL